MSQTVSLSFRPQKGKYEGMTKQEKLDKINEEKTLAIIEEYSYNESLKIMLETYGTISEKEKELAILKKHIRDDKILNPVNLDKTNKNPDFVTRYCASRLSIPENAISVTQITKKVGDKEISYNEHSGLEFGFSYLVKKNTDPSIHMRIFEKEVMSKKTDDQFYDSYELFVAHYSDEKFIEKEISKLDFTSDEELPIDDIPSEQGSPYRPKSPSTPVFHIDDEEVESDTQSDYSEDY